jgi:hypothetical protein
MTMHRPSRGANVAHDAEHDHEAPAAQRSARIPRLLGPLERGLMVAVLDVKGPPLRASVAQVDWATVLSVARSAKILPTLAHRVLAESIAIPDPRIQQLLRNALQETAVHNTRLLAELSAVSRHLSRAGIDHVALKGAVLMANHYPHIAMRHAVDIDLLVDPQCFDEAIALLCAAGYADAPYTRALSFDGRTFAAALRAPHFHAHTPLSGASGVSLDIHRRIPTSGFETSGGFAGFLARAQRTVIHGVTVPTCHPHDLAVHLCEHFAIQHRANPCDAARLLCDLRVLFEGEPPWATLLGGTRVQRTAMTITRRLYDAVFFPDRMPLGISRLAQHVAIADPVLAVPLGALSRGQEHAARLIADLVERPGFALRKALPTRAYLEQRFGSGVPTQALYMRYLRALVHAPAGVPKPDAHNRSGRS